MAVPKKRIPVPEDASEFWAWAEKQTSLPSSIVFVVRAFIAQYGDGDAINAFSFGASPERTEKRGRKPKDADTPVVQTSTVHPVEKPAAEEAKAPEAVPVQMPAVTQAQPVMAQQVTAPAPMQTVSQPTTEQPVQTFVTTVSQEDNTADSILSQLSGNSNSDSSANDSASDSSEAMLASIMNI